jgi:hypothetical protein
MPEAYNERVKCQFLILAPNPPIAEEFWEIGMSEQGMDAGETQEEGMRRALRAGGSGRRPPQVMQGQHEDTAEGVGKRGLENPRISTTFWCRQVQVITGSKRRPCP